MPAPVEPTAHTVRPSVLDELTTWRLGADALMREGADGIARFPYDMVVALRLSFVPTRLDTARHSCELRLSDGRSARIVSTHYRSFGDFEDRASTYVPLVRGLVAQVAVANPSAHLYSGKAPLAYWLENAFLIAMLGLLAVILALVGGDGLIEVVLIKLTVIAALIPLAIRYARKNRPRRFDASTIPTQILPRG